MMKTLSIKPNTVIEISSALFIFLFIYTGINKFLVLRELKIALKDYPLIGSMSDIIAWVLPASELIISILLFVPYTRLFGLYSSLLLMILFTLYLSYMLIFTQERPCTCGGMLQKLSWPQHFIFNIFFITLAAISIKLYKKQQKRRTDAETSSVLIT
jgi:putative oxidoreductase